MPSENRVNTVSQSTRGSADPPTPRPPPRGEAKVLFGSFYLCWKLNIPPRGLDELQITLHLKYVNDFKKKNKKNPFCTWRNVCNVKTY